MIGGRFEALMENEDDVQTLTSEFSKIVHDTALATWGKARTKKQQFEPPLEKARRRKLQWFGRETRRYVNLAHTITHDTVDGMRGQGRPRLNWLDDVKRWSGRTIVECIRLAEDREKWKNVVTLQSAPRVLGLRE